MTKVKSVLETAEVSLRAELLKLALECTLGKEDKKDALSKKARNIVRIIEISDFGCKKQAVTDLMSELLGEKLPCAKSSSSRPPGTVVVPTGNPNSHNYKLGEPCIVLIARQAMRADGTTGNSLPDVSEGYVRLAKEDEVKAFVKAVPIKSIAPYLISVMK